MFIRHCIAKTINPGLASAGYLTFSAAVALFVILASPCGLDAQVDHNQPPINYDTAERTDRVARLIAELTSGEKSLQWDQQHGWLPDMLNKLAIPPSSQTLVFSKTSQQHRKIRPSNPRAIYFNDDVYLGVVQSGEFLEIAAVDPELGAVFYTLDQAKHANPMIVPAQADCLSCHESRKTQSVPGFLVRSVYPKRNGHPDFRFGTTPTDHRTPFSDRFGGWYVTGQHGQMRHRGNVLVADDAVDEATALDREAGANLKALPKRAKAETHLRDTSDIVALMILEHQTQFHNFVTKASYETRRAIHYQTQMNELLERDIGYQSDSTKRRIKAVAEDLVRYLFFCDEAALDSEIAGDTQFKSDFSSAGIRDSKGRSLRDLDLKKRLLKYPCSYLIYSQSFLSLPPSVLSEVKDQMNAVLSGANTSADFSHLLDSDREAIFELLSETHPLFQPQ